MLFLLKGCNYRRLLAADLFMTKRTLLLLLGGGGILILLTIVVVFLRSRSITEPPLATTQVTSSIQKISTATETKELQAARKQQEADVLLFKDNDGDGLSDTVESEHKTDIRKIDTDEDGFTDQEEISFLKTDPLKPNAKDQVKLLIEAMERSPIKELLLTRHVVSTPPAPLTNESVLVREPETQRLDTEIDSDGDGLTDAQEINTYKTDPQKKDTDGDSYPDADEIKNGYNPLGSGTCATPTCIP